MINLQVLPQRLAFLSAGLAFVTVWIVGLVYGVPVYRISLRAVAGAGVFWLIGLAAGRIFLDKVCDAVSEQLYKPEEENKPESDVGGIK